MAMAIRLTCSGASPAEIEDKARAAAIKYFQLPSWMDPIDTRDRLVVHDFTATPVLLAGGDHVIAWEAEVEVVLRERS